jgi:alcohol dehydrogenase (cytochrome c)
MAGAPPSGRAVNVPYSKLLNAAADPNGWYTYSGSYQSHRHSELDQINARNVKDLRVVWQYQSSAKETVFESTPLVVDGRLYLTEPPAGVVALDAANGSVQWRYARDVPDGVALCCGPVNRGVAVLDSLLFVGTLDAQLVALHARTGNVVWERQVADWRAGYSITGAPLGLKNMVVTGVGGGEYGIRGFIAAYDAATGQQRWRFQTIPVPGEPGSETWEGGSWKHGGGPTWLTGSYDPTLNLIYWGVGNPAPDFNGTDRTGDNLYSNSVVAIEPDSGRLRWHFQFTPHDEHDWDAVQVPVLIDATYRGAPRQLMAWANRNAFFYLLDRKTGEFLFARQFARQTWADRIDSTGRPVVRPHVRPTSEGSLVYPGVAGATNWWSPSYSPRTGLFYIPAMEGSAVVFSEPARYTQGEPFSGSDAQPSSEIQTAIRAIDPLTGELKWQHAFATRTEWHRTGGILSVAGDVVFIGDEATLYAFDARTGAELWRFNTGGTIAGAPVTYAVDGRQYMAVFAGRALLAFGLDGGAPKPQSIR